MGVFPIKQSRPLLGVGGPAAGNILMIDFPSCPIKLFRGSRGGLETGRKFHKLGNNQEQSTSPVNKLKGTKDSGGYCSKNIDAHRTDWNTN